MTLSPTFLQALQVETAILQAKHHVIADVLSRAHALLIDGKLFPEDDGHTASVWSSDGTKVYYVNGSCGCPAATYNDAVCKHRYALRLYQRVCDILVEDQDRWAISEPTVQADIPAQFLVELHGKQFVLYAGLLSLAHQRGLVSLSATLISATESLALATATATFADGRTFTECADATPQNVGKQIAPHFIRMSLTRAKARCLRDALCIAMCSLEELADN